MKLLHNFLNKETSGSVVMLIAAVLAIVLANLESTQELYQAFLNLPIELHIDGLLNINKSLLLWVNDALMAVFFILVGLEVKHELVHGTLTSLKHVMFPVIAALGGMVVPALIYLAFNYQDPIARSGWAIPIATDIAFVLSVFSLLGKNIPITLKSFLMTIAIIDDLGAIIIIALFYTKSLSLASLSIAIVAVAALMFLNMYNIHYIGIYVVVGIILWIATLKSGIHATLAGFIFGLFIPLRREGNMPSARQLRDKLNPLVIFMILPIFAFSNAGLMLKGMTMNELTLTLPLGIIAGLLIGKPLGISLFCWIALRLKLALLPVGTIFKQIIMVSVLCGIGFTMSIFIASLAFNTLNQQIISYVKFSILVSSMLSACIGYTLLKINLYKLTWRI